MRGHMHMVAGSWTECAKYSIEGKKIEENLKGRNRVRLDPKAREAVNAKYVQRNQNEIFVCRPTTTTTTIRTRKKRVFILRDRIKTYLRGQWPVILIT